MANETNILMTRDCIEKCIALFDENCLKEEAFLSRLISKYPKNNNFDEIFIKVNAINTLYSAGLNSIDSKVKRCCELEDEEELKLSKQDKKSAIDVYAMSERIFLNDKLGKWIESQDKEDRIKAVYYIATGSENVSENISSTTKKHFSFASKYCAWHNPDGFPISDRYSRGMIYYSAKNGFKCSCLDVITQKHLNSYKDYYDIYVEFLCFVNNILEKSGGRKIGIRDLDKYLWVYGRCNKISYD